MADLDLDQTTKEGEESFNFDRWVIENELTEIKPLLEKHGMIHASSIAAKSNEFMQFLNDEEILKNKSYMIPKVFSAIINNTQSTTQRCYIYHTFWTQYEY